MKVLESRISNLIYQFNLNLDNKLNSDNFHLNYQAQSYREVHLVDLLRDSIIYFALTKEEFEKCIQEGAFPELYRKAWSRISSASANSKGDYGEFLLFLLLTHFYKAPRFVTKVRLRSTKKDQIKGYDCAHFTNNDNEGVVLWLGEAKFHKTFSSAVSKAFESIKDHLDIHYLEDEISILSSSVEVNNDDDAKAVEKHLLSGISLDEVKIKVPVLLTYDSECIKLNTETSQNFRTELEEELKNHHLNIKGRSFAKKHNIEFVFMLFPFADVENVKQLLATVEAGYNLAPRPIKPKPNTAKNSTKKPPTKK